MNHTQLVDLLDSTNGTYGSMRSTTKPYIHTDLESIINNQHLPKQHDMCIYMRCLPRHYLFNEQFYYEMILNNTNYEDIWVFENPQCIAERKLTNKVNQLLSYFYDDLNAKR